MSILFDYMIKFKQNKIANRNMGSSAIIHSIKNFYIELKWCVKSRYIPLFSKLCPNDVLKIYKHGNSVRIDFNKIKSKGYNFITRKHTLLIILNEKLRSNCMLIPFEIYLLDHSTNSYCVLSKVFNYSEKMKIIESSLRYVQKKNQTTLKDIMIHKEKEVNIKKFKCNIYKVKCLIHKRELKKNIVYTNINKKFIEDQMKTRTGYSEKCKQEL